MNGEPLVYLDNAATSQKPKSVIEAITAFYQKENANIYRGTYALSAKQQRLMKESGRRQQILLVVRPAK